MVDAATRLLDPLSHLGSSQTGSGHAHTLCLDSRHPLPDTSLPAQALVASHTDSQRDQMKQSSPSQDPPICSEPSRACAPSLQSRLQSLQVSAPLCTPYGLLSLAVSSCARWCSTCLGLVSRDLHGVLAGAPWMSVKSRSSCVWTVMYASHYKLIEPRTECGC